MTNQIEEWAHATEWPEVVADRERIEDMSFSPADGVPVDAIVCTWTTAVEGTWEQVTTWVTTALVGVLLARYAAAAPGRLWMGDNSEVLCERHGGRSLAAAVASDPTAGEHHTDSGTWVAYSRADVHRSSLTCETCRTLAQKAAEDAVAAVLPLGKDA